MKDKNKKSESGSESEKSEGLLMGGVVRRRAEPRPVKEEILKYETRKAQERDERLLGDYCQKQFDVFPQAFILTLLNDEAVKGADFLERHVAHAEKPRVVLGKIKSAIFFTVMSNEGMIYALKPERYHVEGQGLFKKNEEKWRIKDCALKTILNYGSKSHKQHKEDDPTETLEKIYKLLEKKYSEDPLFASNVDQRWKKEPKAGSGKESYSQRSSSDSESESGVRLKNPKH